MSKSAPKLMYLEEEIAYAAAFVPAFEDLGFEVRLVATVDEAIELFGKDEWVGVLTDSTGGLPLGFERLVAETKRHKNTMLFVLTQLPYDPAVLALKSQTKLLTKPLAPTDIAKAIKVNIDTWRYRISYDDGLKKVVNDSIDEVVGFYLENGLKLDDLKVKKGTRIDGQIMGMIPMTGDTVLGSFCISFDRPLVQTIAAAMLAMEIEELPDEEAIDVVSEICNQIAGILKDRLKELGHDVNIGLPKALAGEDLELIHPGGNDVGSITFSVGHAKSGLFKKKKKNAVEFCFDKVG